MKAFEGYEYLNHEFRLLSGSFFLKLREKGEWDKSAFKKLVQSMWKCCEYYESKDIDEINRLVVMGFWFTYHTIRPWSQTDYFKAEESPEYYKKAYEIIDMLAEWLFNSCNPYHANATNEMYKYIMEEL